MTADSIVAIARRFDFVRETEGANRGLWVEMFQRFTGNAPGESWCASFVCYVLSVVYRGHPPIVRSASCDVLLADCRAKRLVVETPRAGDLVFSVKGTDAHHVGIATSEAVNGTLSVVAGNTSADGKSDNGTGVYEHPVTTAGKVYVRLPEAA